MNVVVTGVLYAVIAKNKTEAAVTEDTEEEEELDLADIQIF